MPAVKPGVLSLAFTCGLLVCGTPATAGLEQFVDGPLIRGFGKHAMVADNKVNSATQLKVAFDVAAAADQGKLNRRFDSLARFLNMHAAAGVKPENMQLALVVHGKASLDLLGDAAYRQRYGTDNANTALIQVLLANRVNVIICGQSATAQSIDASQLIDGVDMALSAMTAHALLQQQGYTVNPF